MLTPIYTETAECQDCYKCVRHCPVKTIKVEDGHAQIMTEECILCGKCVGLCPVGAKKVRDDLSTAKRIVKEKKKTILSLAPSFISEFPSESVHSLIGKIKNLGFWGVSETALGAQEVSRHTIDTMDQSQKGIFISSACPTIVEYIKIHKNQYSPLIMEHLSPLLTHCEQLKSYYGKDTNIIFAGPCISKKREADLRPDLLKAAITFSDLKKWLEQKNQPIQEETENNFIPFSAQDGALYPFEGGMIDSLKTQNNQQNFQSLSFSNIDKMEEILEGLEGFPSSKPLFIELLACQGGCINGPCSQVHQGTAIKELKVKEFANKPKEKHSIYCSDINFSREIKPFTTPYFSEIEIRETLKKIGKFAIDDEKNCGACGYMTCRDYAKAFLDGRAEKNMCVSYLKKLSEKQANALITKMPSGVVIADSDMKIIQCNRAFAKLIGPEIEEAFEAKPGLKGGLLQKIIPFANVFTGVLMEEGNLTNQTFQIGDKVLNGSIFSIEKHQVVGGIFQDVTLPWVQRDRIIQQAKQVMEKNISAVQQIAYLLGENAAESEVMLNSIVESFSKDNQGLESQNIKGSIHE